MKKLIGYVLLAGIGYYAYTRYQQSQAEEAAALKAEEDKKNQQIMEMLSKL